MATAAPPATRAPLPAQAPPVLHVAQLVVVCLATDRDVLQVLVRRTNPAQKQDKTDTPYVLPRRWIGRPTDLEGLASRVLEPARINASRVPTKMATTTVEAVEAVRPAAGLINLVMTVLTPTTTLADPNWSWLPAAQVPHALTSWDAAATQSARDTARELLRDTDTALRLLPETFTLGDLRRIYSSHWDLTINPSNFARRVLSRADESGPFLDFVSELEGLPGKPTALYRRGSGGAPQLAPP